jgi:hypothetical protein
MNDSFFAKIDSDQGFLSLRQHFPQINSNYSKWRTMNKGLRGVESRLYMWYGASGNKPATAAGMAALEANNDVLEALVAELTEIQGLTGITGQCDQCNELSSS